MDDLTNEVVGECEKYNGEAIVCFLDLLGFSEFILKNWKNSKNNPLEKIQLLKKVISDKENSCGLTLKLHNSDGIRETNYRCNVRSVSDSIIITVPIGGKMTIADVFFSILALINNIGRLWGFCLQSSFTIRGGIDYGYIYWDKDEIIGPAFISAYSMESNSAKTSRIVCGEKFSRLILDISEKVDTMSAKMLENFIFDVDGLLCVNPNIMYDELEHKADLIAVIRKLMAGKTSYIQQKYISLEKALYRKERLKIPTLDDLREYTGVSAIRSTSCCDK